MVLTFLEKYAETLGWAYRERLKRYILIEKILERIKEPQFGRGKIRLFAKVNMCILVCTWKTAGKVETKLTAAIIPWGFFFLREACPVVIYIVYFILWLSVGSSFALQGTFGNV